MIALLIMTIGIGMAGTAAPWALIYCFARYRDGIILNGLLTVVGLAIALSAYRAS